MFPFTLLTAATTDPVNITVPEGSTIDPSSIQTEIVYPSDIIDAAVTASEPRMTTLITVCVVVFMLISIVLMVIILMQKKRASGFSSTFTGGGDNYWSKNKGRSLEGSLEKYTKILTAAFLIFGLVLNFII